MAGSFLALLVPGFSALVPRLLLTRAEEQVENAFKQHNSSRDEESYPPLRQRLLQQQTKQEKKRKEKKRGQHPPSETKLSPHLPFGQSSHHQRGNETGDGAERRGDAVDDAGVIGGQVQVVDQVTRVQRSLEPDGQSQEHHGQNRIAADVRDDHQADGRQAVRCNDPIDRLICRSGL